MCVFCARARALCVYAREEVCFDFVLVLCVVMGYAYMCSNWKNQHIKEYIIVIIIVIVVFIFVVVVVLLLINDSQ